jgi:alpha-N-arabinofuranosidase
MELMSKNATGLSLTPSEESPKYNAGERGDVCAIDVSASYDPATGETNLFIVNRRHDEDATVRVKLSDRLVTRVIGGEAIGGQDVKTTNTWDSPDAVKRFAAEARAVDGAVEVHLKAPGFAQVRVATKER